MSLYPFLDKSQPTPLAPRLSAPAISSFLLALLLTVFILPATGRTAENELPAGKIVFLPFAVQTDPPQQYLESGLTDMLATRITSQTGLAAIHKSSETRQLAAFMEKGDQQSFIDMLRTIQGDYLVIGSLEQKKDDDGYELLVYAFKRDTPAPASYARTITTLDRVIPALDELSREISDNLLGRKAPDQPAGTPLQDEGISGFQTAHPDRAYREGLYQPAAILGLDDDRFKVLSTRRSRKISEPVRAMATGDLDNNGTDEIILVEMGNLAVYRFSSDHFQHVADHPLAGHLAPHAVHLADLNKNKRLEIYISANNGDKPSSQVLEWDGSSFHTLHNDVPYYLRPGLNQEGRQVLIGQTGGTLGPAGDTFYQLEPTDDGSLVRGSTIKVPPGFNLFDFIRADLDLDGSLEIIGINRQNKLIVMDASGEPLWQSEAGYGASKIFLGTMSSNSAAGRKPTYIHSRLIVQDLDNDGKPEIIVGRNRLTTVKYFSRLRYFEGSSISALRWNETEMTPLWETKKVAGYTTDYQIVTKEGEMSSFNLFFIESDSSYPFFFWESEKSALHLYSMGRK